MAPLVNNIPNLNGTLQNDVGAPTGNTDIPSPNPVDYLKVRAYLYKFTPDILFGGENAAPTSTGQTASKVTILSDKAEHAQRDGALLTQLKDDLEGSDTQTQISALNRLILYINSNPAGPGQVVWANVFTQANLQQAQTLLAQLTAGVPTASTSDFLKTSLLTALGSSINAANGFVSSSNKTVQQVQSDVAVSNVTKQFKVSRFTHDLDVASLSRYDVSKFISSYQVNQTLGALAPGQIVASAVLQNTIIPLTDLTKVPGPTAVRRPWFFPDSNGDYTGYSGGNPLGPGSAFFDNDVPTEDPISKEQVSTLEPFDLIRRIAVAQTLEDNNGTEPFTPLSSSLTDNYQTDIVRIEIAMLLRGIKDERKKQLILKYFSTGQADNELVQMASLINAPRSFSTAVATAQLQQASIQGTPLPGLNASQQKVASQLTSSPGDIVSQRRDLINILLDPKVDGILLSDLVQKYDFFSIFIYKHDVSPDVLEAVVEGATGDPYFFDKESLFMYTPVSYFFNQTTGSSSSLAPGAMPPSSSKHFAMYSPEFNGFVIETASSESAGAVNSISINLTGSMGLMGATKRIYNSTLFNGTVFDAAELANSGGSSGLLTLYQNIFATKDPFQILTTLLDSLYLLRVNIPVLNVDLTPTELSAIALDVQAKLANATPPVSQSVVTAQILAAQEQARQKARNTRTFGGTADYTRDNDKNVVSFLDILSLRAFNQFGEIYKSGPQAGAIKGPKHLFNIASFLYSCVLRSRRFNVRVASSSDVLNLDSDFGGLGINTGVFPYNVDSNGNVHGAFNPFEEKTVVVLPKEADGSGGSVLEIDPYVSIPSTLGNNQSNASADPTQAKAWKAYFLFLSNSFSDFVADVKTGFEIMNDVLNSCYLELFETPGGRFIFRTPQYNNNIPLYRTRSQDGQVTVETPPGQGTIVEVNGIPSYATSSNEGPHFAQMITSDDIIQISAEYHQTAKNLITKQQVGYGADLIGVPIDQLYYFYSNGKMVAQYGLNMAKVEYNPNVRFIPKDKLVVAQSADVNITASTFTNGIYAYCRFFLEYNNIYNFTGSVTAVGDPKIQVGRTYFDTTNQKFGYITQVAKKLSVGDSYVTQFEMCAVRDAVYGAIVGAPQEKIARPTFRLLPEMKDFVSRFISSTTSKPVVNIPSVQAQLPPPDDTFNVLVSDQTVNNNILVSQGKAIQPPYTPQAQQKTLQISP